jgi:hypothetical protein
MVNRTLCRRVQVRFEPPFSQNDWRMTGRFTWPRAGDNAAPFSEWIDDGCNRVWLAGRRVDMIASIDAWRRGQCGHSYSFHPFAETVATIPTLAKPTEPRILLQEFDA